MELLIFAFIGLFFTLFVSLAFFAGRHARELSLEECELLTAYIEEYPTLINMIDDTSCVSLSTFYSVQAKYEEIKIANIKQSWSSLKMRQMNQDN